MSFSVAPRPAIQPYLVTAAQMQQIEGRMFEAGIPVAALMEKVSGKLTNWFVEQLYHDKPYDAPCDDAHKTQTALKQPANTLIGILAGPGHNGGDAMVVARELHHRGFQVCIYQPFSRCKPLTQQHASYAKHLGIPFIDTVEALADCDAIIDGWFGFGLARPITGDLAGDIETLNEQSTPIFSIDLPSGIHTDTGQVMGVALKASHTACLGLWKRAFMQANALDFFGQTALIDFDIPLADIESVLGDSPTVQRITDRRAITAISLHRAPTAHKYTAGHLLLIAGSRQYAGAALLCGLGAIASGVGMLTLAIPESIRLSLLSQLPGALLLGCEETDSGAIARLPATLDLSKYDAIALGPGLTPTVPDLLTTVLSHPSPLLLDADGLNLLARTNPTQQLQNRPVLTVLTPHLGEFKRLFPKFFADSEQDIDCALPGELLPGHIAQQAAQASGATILLKGPRSAIATPETLWFNPYSTPALARGGSGDVLTGLMGGLLASHSRTGKPLIDAVIGAVWWHSQAASYASKQRTVLGVDPLQLAHHLNPALQAAMRLT
ncbi:MAG: NAD(P)H-hydrate dehydratase [Cyanobacteria bacterium J06632_3]